MAPPFLAAASQAIAAPLKRSKHIANRPWGRLHANPSEEVATTMNNFFDKVPFGSRQWWDI
jgi:hypothetical protein